MIALSSAFTCPLLQTQSAEEQLKTQTVEYKQKFFGKSSRTNL